MELFRAGLPLWMLLVTNSWALSMAWTSALLVWGMTETCFLISSTALLIPDLVVYPPIAVLIVDGMHALASRID